MKNKDALFQLIKSLNNNEKRYFTLFAQRHIIGDKNNYLKLFEAIDKQKNSDENKLAKQFEGTSIGNNLRVNRHYLYKLILKSMRGYRSEVSIDVQLSGMLADINFLHEKELYKQCEKQIAQAKQLAQKYQKHWYLSELTRWELILVRVESYLHSNIKEITKINMAMNNYIEQYKNINKYMLLSDKVFFNLKQKGTLRNKRDNKNLNSIIKHSLLNDENKALSVESLYHYYNIYAAHYSYKNDYSNVYLYAKKVLSVFEDNPGYTENNLERYFFSLHNIVVCQLHLKQLDETPLNIQKIKKIKTKSATLQQQLFYSINILEICLYLITGQFKKGRELVHSISDKLDKPEEIGTNHYLELIYNIALIHFGLGEYNKAKSILFRIINDTEFDIRKDLHCFALILQLIVHYELGDDEFISYKVKSTKHFLEKRKVFYQFEKIIMDFFKRQIVKADSEELRIQAFKKLKTQFTEIVKDPFERKALDYFDVISWLESKIEGRAFAEVVREKALGH